MRRVRRFLALPGADRRRILALFPLIAAVRVGLWVLPYSVLARWAGRRSDEVIAPVDVEEWARLVRQASSAVPGASCLTQALVLQRILHRRGRECTIRLGVSQGLEGFAAHAWVEHGGVVVLGGPDVSGYAVMHTSPGPPRS